ncbi:MAG TPA: DUF3891 family protein [Gaiellales bacterium]|nr:DUF3891 family protein [Gaiellales bacterium]
MFRSATRPLVYPQAEHARFAAEIALHWGNDAFARPRLPFESFVRGVALHDRGYGQLDADPIGEVTTERWLEIQQAGAAPTGDDPVVDLVVALHIRRLMANWRTAAESDAARRLDEALPELHQAAGADPADAAEADRITNLCDRISFDFCIEEEATGTVAAPDPVAYAIDGEGEVTLAPWPLRVPRLDGLVVAFQSDGYPQRLVPVVVAYTIRPETSSS